MMPALTPLAAVGGPAAQPSSGAARSTGAEDPPPGAGFSSLLKKASAQSQPVVRDTSARPPARPAEHHASTALDDAAVRGDEATAEDATEAPALALPADAWRPAPSADPTAPPADGLLARPPVDGTDLTAVTANTWGPALPPDSTVPAADGLLARPPADGTDLAAATAPGAADAAAVAAAATMAAAADRTSAVQATPPATGTAIDPSTAPASSIAAPVPAPVPAGASPPPTGRAEFTQQVSQGRLDGGTERRGPTRATSADAVTADLPATTDVSALPAGAALPAAGARPSDPVAQGGGRDRDRAADGLPAPAADSAVTATPPQAADATPLPTLATPTSPPAPAGTPAALAGAPAAGSPNAPVEARVPVPVTSPEFAPAFGLQISTLARDGIEHARLQLNPADLGPITVRIAMDGTGARIDFQADAAVTRQAIESSLPALAGSLREAGLTLTGGGVSQQPQDRPADPRQAGASGRPGGEGRPDAQGAEALLPRPVLAARRGLVDLVA